MDREIARIAERQHGAFTHGQALAAGFTVKAVQRRHARGRWEPVARGVYRLAGAPTTWEQRLMALVLASGPVAAASHGSAAALLGIPGFRRAGVVEVVTPRPRRHRDPTWRAHRWRVLPEHHLTVVEGIVTTRAPRTLVDLAGALHPARVERAVDNCLAAGMVTLDSLASTFHDLARKGRSGIAVMRSILEDRGVGYVAPESPLEARFVELLRAEGLPEPVRQFEVGDDSQWIGRVDFAYPDLGLVIEIDSRRHHTARLDVLADQDRDERLQAAGWAVLRVRSDVLRRRPEDVAAEVRRLWRREPLGRVPPATARSGDTRGPNGGLKCHQKRP